MDRAGEDVLIGFTDWLRALVRTALWAFVFAGCLGLLEGLLHWWIVPGPLLEGQTHGIIRVVSPFVSVYGWAGLILATLFFGPAVLVVSRRNAASDTAVALAIAASFSAPLLIQIGFFLRELFPRGSWNRYESIIVVVVFPLLYILLITLLTRWLQSPAVRTLILNRRRIFLALIVVAVCTALWPDWQQEGCRYRSGDVVQQSVPVAGTPNIILITVDALRRDRLGFMSTNAPATPVLDAFAAESIVYTNAWSSSCWTLPSLASLMTGLPARALGMEIYEGVPGSAHTLAETALRNGYRTAAVVTNPYLTTDYGLDMGFQDYEHSLVIEPLIPAKASLLVRGINHFWTRYIGVEDADIVLTKVTTRLAKLSAGSDPWFFWTHLMEPHLPYRIHDPEIFGRAAYRADLPDHPLFNTEGLPVSSLGSLRERAAVLPDSLAAAVRRAYDDEITYLDARLGLFFAELKALGIYRESLIILVADHGEEFFEHGGFEHGHSLMPQISGIPLVVHLPDGVAAGTRVDSDCSLLDILPTLCASLGWEAPADLVGCPELWTLDGAPSGRCRSRPAHPRLVEKMLYGTDQLGVLSWPWYGYRDAGGYVRWYDLLEDPGALRVLPDPPGYSVLILEKAAGLLQQWDDYSRRFDIEHQQNNGPSPEVRRQLESLGY